MFKNIQTLENKNTCLSSILSRAAVIVASFVDTTLSLYMPFIIAIEKLAFAAINFLGACLCNESCNFKDGWESLRTINSVKDTGACSYYYWVVVNSFPNAYLNLEDPAEALPLLAARGEPFNPPELNSWIYYPDRLEHTATQLTS